MKTHEYKIDKETNLVKPTHGVSLNIDPSKLISFGGAFRINGLPDELKIIQRGSKMHHFEIVPRKPMPVEKFQELLRKIKL